ncbi:MAG: SoxR reducing system RseC family protein [Deltaproteobacteria bacterium]|nr:SoxR reducing system RseC family protein [Deltaproteobacteria bacterium]
MIEEIGVVVSVEGTKATVRTERSHACEGCASAGFCNLSEGEGAVTVVAKNPLEASVGQTVRVAIPTESFLSGTFFLYLFPLIGLFAGMAAGIYFSGIFSLKARDPAAASGALIGLVLFFLLQRLFNQRISGSPRFQPAIVEIF